MKTSHLFLLATPILAAVAPATTAERCGSLGVMTYTAASLDTSAAGGTGVHPAQIRTCQDHPLGPVPRPEHAVGPHYGCSGGYCYKACDGNGRWCWTARNRGYGDWQTCDTNSDCANLDNVGCGKGCASCGCGC
ncbi:hypothetical protein BDP67DRAFT_592438 [Colletotrichum lupini]|nr:hypothetical protein BDP67DRAFT_592438 [Colletotrichum lupini]